jgi:Raf kinase inhibitor-like YbhB/YbcL family protein
MRTIILVFLSVIFFFSCQNKNPENTQVQSESQKQKKEERRAEMKLTSSAFEDGGIIPGKYTCDGDNISPPLTWSGIPEGTKCFAITCDDPDAPAGNWIHWVIYNIPSNVSELKENIPVDKILNDKTKQGLNDFGKTGYGGPCPPGGTHRYIFKIYAVNKNLDIKPEIKKSELLKEIDGNILAEALLTGKYKRN